MLQDILTADRGEEENFSFLLTTQLYHCITVFRDIVYCWRMEVMNCVSLYRKNNIVKIWESHQHRKSASFIPLILRCRLAATAIQLQLGCHTFFLSTSSFHFMYAFTLSCFHATMLSRYHAFTLQMLSRYKCFHATTLSRYHAFTLPCFYATMLSRYHAFTL